MRTLDLRSWQITVVRMAMIVDRCRWYGTIRLAMPVPNKSEYARALMERLSESVVVPLQSINVLQEDGVWYPKARECHANSSYLEANCPGKFAAVRGWLVFDFRPLFGEFRFMHHSVVKEIPTGRLFDPTPQDRLNPDYPFLESKLLESDYTELVESMEMGELLYCKTA